jgi:hypothetical protein
MKAKGETMVRLFFTMEKVSPQTTVTDMSRSSAFLFPDKLLLAGMLLPSAAGDSLVVKF